MRGGSSPRIQRPRPSQPGATVELRIDALAPGGDAVGRQQGGAADGRATFVALAAPGERIQARLTREKARVAWADLVAVQEPSPHRVTPPCALFGKCGGCQWQHVDLETQRTAKRGIVARALDLPDVPLVVPVAAGAAYRDRAQLVVGTAGVLGFRARRSHDIVDVAFCLLLSPALQAALGAIRTSSSSFESGTEIDLQAGREGVHVQILIPRARPLPEGFAGLPPAWREAGVVGVRLVGGGGDQRAFGLPDVDIAGGDPAEAPLRVPAGAFAQVGAAANQTLVEAVLRFVGEHPGKVLELYAGSGNFTRALLARAAAVTACDADAAAVSRGRMNAPAAKWMVRPPPVVDADTAVADPPRDGLDAENLQALLQARRRIIYVSCDPQTLGRDAARLSQSGFVLTGALALDLMPHTYHVEVVAIFERARSRADS